MSLRKLSYTKNSGCLSEPESLKVGKETPAKLQSCKRNFLGKASGSERLAQLFLWDAAGQGHGWLAIDIVYNLKHSDMLHPTSVLQHAHQKSQLLIQKKI